TRFSRDWSSDVCSSDLIGGTEDPQIVFGFGTNLRYKLLDFGFFFQGLSNTYRIIGGANFIPGSANGSMGNIFSNVDDRWTVDNRSEERRVGKESRYRSA